MATRMSKTEKTTWQALQAALRDREPACQRDSRFIADDPSNRDQADMKGMCDACPLLRECGKYAPYATAGFWAGQLRGTTHGRVRRAA